MGSIATALLGVLAAALPAASYPRPVASSQLDAIPGAFAPTKDALNTSIAATGRYVAFDSESNLLDADSNLDTDVYLRDLKTDELWLASVGGTGESGVGAGIIEPPGAAGWGPTYRTPVPLSWDPAVSGNGRFVAFISQALNLVPGDTNLAPDIFVFDRKGRSVERASVDSAGKEGGPLGADILPESWGPSMDLKGQRVAFSTKASLDERDTNLASDIYVRDLRSDKTILASIGRNGEGATDDCVNPPVIVGTVCPSYVLNPLSTGAAISADGQHVVYQSAATNLVEGDTNKTTDVFVRDLAKDQTERISISSSGEEVGNSQNPGGYTIEISVQTNTFENATRLEHAISADGRFVVFSSRANGLIPNDTSGGLSPTQGDHDYFVYDGKTKRVERVSISSTGVEASFTGGEHEIAAISGDGRYVAFSGYLDKPLAPAGSPEGAGTWVYDRKTGSLELVSRTTEGKTGRGCRSEATPDDQTWGDVDTPDISANGRYVAYQTCNTNMYSYPDRDIENAHVILTDRGAAVGNGGFGSGRDDEPPKEPERICITGDLCIDPLGWIEQTDPTENRWIPSTADLIGARIAYRPQHDDLFVVQEIERLPSVVSTGNRSDSDSSLHGLRFEVDEHRYEVRAVSQSGGTFGLFECAGGSSLCDQIATLEGGYGTTGERIVFSLPLGLVGLDDYSYLTDVEAYTARGTFHTGPFHIQDTLQLGPN